MALKKKRGEPKRHRRAAAAPAASRSPEEVAKIIAETSEILREIDALPTLHDVDPDEWLYDERGLPH